MRIGVVDIGSNTARLLVADVSRDAVTPVSSRRAYLGLGEEIARTGRLSGETIDRTAMLAGAYAARARVQGALAVETLVTAPGRQAATGAALVDALERGTAAPVRILSADEEGRLAFAGVANAAGASLPETIGVIDVGGGSTEITVGSPSRGPTWVRSVDLGSQRLVHRAFAHDPPTRKEVRAARELVRRAIDARTSPRPEAVFATGGSARAAARIVGRELTVDDLEELVTIARRRPAVKLSKTFRLHPHRARALLAGTLLLAEVSRALGRPLLVSSAGMREGAALSLATPAVAAA